MQVHVESRVAAAVGEAFYTIGPGGEELMACVGVQLRDTDATALHYRHLATQMARALRSNSMEQARATSFLPSFCFLAFPVAEASRWEHWRITPTSP